jgi:cobalt/nickel transport system ATP-binding protein
MSAVLMEARGLGYHYEGSHWALRNVCLRICASDRLAVLGANGAGKSTLLLALAGLLPLAEGQLFWEGQPVQTGKSRTLLRDKVGLLLQDPEDQLFAPTVEQDVAFGLAQRGTPESIALEHARSVLDDLLISHLASRPVHKLSLGEKKRVALAGLLAVHPKLLLLDEPTAGLDHEGTRSLLEALERLHAGGAAVVLTTHDSHLAAQWASRVAILDGGQIAAEGGKERILLDRAVLDKARLTPPLPYVAATLLQKLYPPSTAWPLPATALELEQFILRIAQSMPNPVSDSQRQ